MYPVSKNTTSSAGQLSSWTTLSSSLPPHPVKVLFVGVAPPEKGRHFYTHPNDNLRRGLFGVLNQLLQAPHSCTNISDFLRYGFFLLHTAKCAIRGTIKPSLPVSQFCSSLHLRREIELLLPDAVCFLSKNVGYPVAKELYRCYMKQSDVLAFGQVASIRIKAKEIFFLATTWPGRPSLAPTTQCHLGQLFKKLNLKLL
ncbi:MAG: uracil-DNA glycosylase family protein [Candidatus Binatia bacterium]